jgi:hypothetical protein
MPFTDFSGDRKYNASAFREYFGSLLENGVIGQEGNELLVKPQAVPNKTVYIDTGTIFIEGAIRVLQSPQTLSFADNTSGLARIDRVIARLNFTDRKIEFAVLQGTPAASPVAPALTRNSSCFEVALADISLANGYSSIIAGIITDKRSDETVCGYFKYKAKPAWYPEGGTPSIDAWMYTNFRNQLSSGERADIEANSSLMSIILDSPLYNFTLGLKSMEMVLNAAYVGTKTCTNGETLSGIIYCDSFTVPAGVTVYTPSGTLCLIVCEGTADISGTIDASGKGGAGGTGCAGNPVSGGNGGGNVHLIANKITGTGTIKANGVNGAAGTSGTPSGSAPGNAGGTGYLSFGKTAEGGGSSYYTSSTGSAGGAATCGISWTRTTLLGLWELMHPQTTGGAGGGGGMVDASTSNGGKSAAGGAGAGGNSGGGGSTASSDTQNGGAGGGGGGLIILFSRSSISVISLQATGGNGGAAGGGTSPHAGGGGGGGAIICLSKSDASIKTVSGGIGENLGSAGISISSIF